MNTKQIISNENEIQPAMPMGSFLLILAAAADSALAGIMVFPS